MLVYIVGLSKIKILINRDEGVDVKMTGNPSASPGNACVIKKSNEWLKITPVSFSTESD